MSLVVDLGESHHNASAVAEEGKGYFENADLSHHMAVLIHGVCF